LCGEFGFTELAANLSQLHPSINFKERETEAKTEDADRRGRMAILEEKSNQHSHINPMLEDKVTQLVIDCERFVGEVSALQSAAAEFRHCWKSFVVPSVRHFGDHSG
jgi:hypothetical protein